MFFIKLNSKRTISIYLSLILRVQDMADPRLGEHGTEEERKAHRDEEGSGLEKLGEML